MIELQCQNCGNIFYNYPSNNRKLCSNACRHEQRSKTIRGENHPNYRHGLSNTPFHQKWCTMIQRCNDKNSSGYHKYGERGIKICKEWLVFENFYKDMFLSYKKHVKKHGRKNTSIERIDPNKNYCKDNCTWATLQEQSYNKRNSLKITYLGKTKCLKEWSREYAPSYEWFYKQIKLLGRKPKDVFAEADNWNS